MNLKEHLEPPSVASEISQVVVHARGAWITRTFTGNAPTGAEIEIDFSGITPMAEPGSVRAAVAGARRVVSVHSSLEIQSESHPLGPTVERVLELENQRMRLDEERILLEETIAQVSSTMVDPGAMLRAREESAAQRFDASLRISELLREVSRSSVERLSLLWTRIAELDEELEKKRLEDAQTSDRERMGKGHPKRKITVRLAGEGPVEQLSVSYVVRAARWWPIYSLSIASGGTSAELNLDALVAQRTGEDWRGVSLGLSTSDLLRDAQLPKLDSLRLGKAQPAARSGFREPPAGLDALFGPYDRVFGSVAPTQVVGGALMDDSRSERYREEDALVTLEASVDEMPGAPPMAKASRGAPERSKKRKAGAPPPPAAAAPAMMRASALAERAADGISFAAQSMPEASFGGGGPPEASPPEPEPAQFDLSGAWLDFDRLRLAPASEHAHRGRLHPAAGGPEAKMRRKAERAIEALWPRDLLSDPLAERGSFDHRYDGAGRVDVPSDGLSHRLRLFAKSSPPRFSYRVVPREAPEVYREVEFDNPFESPLLGGPVEVYLDGTMLLIAPLRATERGGRIRVDVEVLERSPVADQPDLEVVLLPSEPKPEKYTQEDRDTPIRGGWRWSLRVGASESRTLNWGYKLVFPSKQEVVGGNRRE